MQKRKADRLRASILSAGRDTQLDHHLGDATRLPLRAGGLIRLPRSSTPLSSLLSSCKTAKIDINGGPAHRILILSSSRALIHTRRPQGLLPSESGVANVLFELFHPPRRSLQPTPLEKLSPFPRSRLKQPERFTTPDPDIKGPAATRNTSLSHRSTVVCQCSRLLTYVELWLVEVSWRWVWWGAAALRPRAAVAQKLLG